MYGCTWYCHLRCQQVNNLHKKRRLHSQTKTVARYRQFRIFVQGLKIPATKSQWNNYYEETVLSDEYVQEKKNILQQWLKELPVNTYWMLELTQDSSLK
jgi:outer membrane cobalamin receptor